MSRTSDEQRAIDEADNGESKRQWEARKYKVAMQSELNAIDQLAQRIAYMAAAERRLAEYVVRPPDADTLRAISLALTSAYNCIQKVLDVATQVDRADGRTLPSINLRYEECEHSMDGIDGFASDLQFQANSQSYQLGLIPSRRRPDPAAMHFMCHLIAEMRHVVEVMGRQR
ncbi:MULTISPECIES: hypothetical protein [Streptomyces]|uniref:hypothetical protein n=1 Tax=Streptomyces TaxID=1883 RepID=UPI0036511CD4